MQHTPVLAINFILPECYKASKPSCPCRNYNFPLLVTYIDFGTERFNQPGAGGNSTPGAARWNWRQPGPGIYSHSRIKRSAFLEQSQRSRHGRGPVHIRLLLFVSHSVCIASGGAYQWADEQRQVHFSDIDPLRTESTEVILESAHPDPDQPAPAWQADRNHNHNHNKDQLNPQSHVSPGPGTG